MSCGIDVVKERIHAIMREVYQMCLDAGLCPACRAKAAEVGNFCAQCADRRAHNRKEGL